MSTAKRFSHLSTAQVENFYIILASQHPIDGPIESWVPEAVLSLQAELEARGAWPLGANRAH